MAGLRKFGKFLNIAEIGLAKLSHIKKSSESGRFKIFLIKGGGACVSAETYKCLGQHAYVLAETNEATPDFEDQHPPKD